jgi:hypothetical protein
LQAEKTKVCEAAAASEKSDVVLLAQDTQLGCGVPSSSGARLEHHPSSLQDFGGSVSSAGAAAVCATAAGTAAAFSMVCTTCLWWWWDASACSTPQLTGSASAASSSVVVCDHNNAVSRNNPNSESKHLHVFGKRLHGALEQQKRQNHHRRLSDGSTLFNQGFCQRCDCGCWLLAIDYRRQVAPSQLPAPSACCFGTHTPYT